MEEYVLYSDTRKRSKMSEHGNYVIKYMFYENNGEEIVDLEGKKKTEGSKISWNVLSIENIIYNQSLNGAYDGGRGDEERWMSYM